MSLQLLHERSVILLSVPLQLLRARGQLLVRDSVREEPRGENVKPHALRSTQVSEVARGHEILTPLYAHRVAIATEVVSVRVKCRGGALDSSTTDMTAGTPSSRRPSTCSSRSTGDSPIMSSASRTSRFASPDPSRICWPRLPARPRRFSVL